MLKKSKWAVSLLLIPSVLAACSGGNEAVDKKDAAAPNASQETKAPQPVELGFYYNGGNYGEEQFMNYYGHSIVKKFPHVKLKFYQTGKGGGTDALTLADLVATKTPIDIMYTALANVPTSLISYGLQQDITDLIKTSNFDLSTLHTGAVESIRTIGDGKLYGLPVGGSNAHLIYNKDLFDKFGVPYPKDGMTWDETYELAQRMTRKEGDIQYRGIILGFEQLMTYNQLSAGFVDPKTNKSTFTTDNKWPKLVNNITRFYQIPGNEVTPESVVWSQQLSGFTTGGTVAMMGSTHALSQSWTINWDIARFPVFSDLPGVGNPVIPNFFGVTNTSPHKNEAFQVIAYLASKDFQIEQSRKGIAIPVVTAPEAREAYGKEIPFLQGKTVNTQAMFPQKYADTYGITRYDATARKELVTQLNALVTGQTPDVNTALRTAAEAADKAIQEQIAASK